MCRPKLSIELICQDEEELIAQCCRYMIKLAEAVKGLVEIIIVDGGSVDNTPDIINGIFRVNQPENCIFSFKQNPWRGFKEQRDYIYSLCRGEWILNMSADHLFTDPMFVWINIFLSSKNVISYSFGKIHLYKDIDHMLDTTNRDPMIALHKNDGNFGWEKSSVGLERMTYKGKEIIGHPAHFTYLNQKYNPDIIVVHFEGLKSKDSLFRKYLKRSKIEKNRWHGLPEEEIWKRVSSTPPICPISKYYPGGGLKFYHEIERRIG